MFRCWMTVSLCGLWMCTGCGGSDHPELGYVTGTVTVGGRPLENAVVTFTPSDGRPSKGTTDSSGRFALSYTQNAEGAMIGTHRVRVVKLQTPEEDDLPEGVKSPNALPEAATDGSLMKEVKPGSNDIAIEL
jgi:hypothetical protein